MATLPIQSLGIGVKHLLTFRTVIYQNDRYKWLKILCSPWSCTTSVQIWKPPLQSRTECCSILIAVTHRWSCFLPSCIGLGLVDSRNFLEDILNRLPHIEYRCLSSYSLVKTHGAWWSLKARNGLAEASMRRQESPVTEQSYPWVLQNSSQQFRKVSRYPRNWW